VNLAHWPWARRFRAVFWVLLLLLCSGIAELIPPLQSPDEHSHLARAYLVSKGEFTLATPAGSSSGGQVDSQLAAFWTPYLFTIAVDAKARMSDAETSALQQLRWSQRTQFVALAGTGYYMPLVYAPQAVGLLAGRALNLTIMHSYRLTRWCTLLVCILLLAGAVQLHTPNPLVLALLMLPMSLFQLLSPTLDGMTNCLAVWVLSLFVRTVNQPTPISRLHFSALGFGVLLLATSRAQLLPMLCLPLYLAWQRRSATYFWGTCLVGALTVAWTGYAMYSTVDLRIVRDHSTGELVRYYTSTPWALVDVISASLSNEKLFEFYQHSFIGILGWLDTALPSTAYPALWCALLVCGVAAISSNWRARPAGTRLMLALLALACATLVFAALLVTWTPYPAATVQGVQGRYFLVPAILLAYALDATPAGLPRWNINFSRAALAFFGTASLYAFIATLVTRYH